MKKHILAIILCVLCASFILVFASCGDTDTECTTHNFGDWTTETYASCTLDGLKVRVCQNCGFEEEEVIASAGHKFGEWDVSTELTCEQDGLKERVCSVCDWSEKEEQTAPGHTWGDWTETGAGDCTVDGEVTRECSACGEKETEAVKADGHNFSEWGIGWENEAFVKDATCTEKGYIGRVCFDCGEEERQPTDALGHTWGDWSVVGSCADGATRTRKCTVCGEGATETTQPGEHANVVRIGAVEATKESEGSTGEKKCLACDTVLEKARVIRITKHSSTAIASTSSWAVIAKYINDGDMNTGVTGYGNAVRQTTHTLTWSSEVGIDEIILYFSGDTTGKNIGGNLPGQLANTNPSAKLTVIVYDADDAIVSRTEIQTADLTQYKITFEEQVKAAKIDVINDNLWDTQLCVNIWEVEIYGAEYLSACDLAGSHSWSEWETVDSPVCKQDGSLINGLERRSCPVCLGVEENVLVASHTYGEWDESQIACLTGGTRTRECSICNYVESQTVVAGGHMDAVVEGTVEPTFESEGSTGTTVCKKCGATIEEAKVLSKLVNEALTATPSTNSTNWPIVGNGSNWAPNTIPSINDGNLSTGASTNDWHLKTIDYILTWDTAVALNEIIYVCNGTGNFGYDGNFENTNWEVDYVITVYDENDNVIVTASGNTKDQTQIEVKIPEDSASVKKIVINVDHKNNNIRGGVFEIMAISGGDIVE